MCAVQLDEPAEPDDAFSLCSLRLLPVSHLGCVSPAPRALNLGHFTFSLTGELEAGMSTVHTATQPGREWALHGFKFRYGKIGYTFLNPPEGNSGYSSNGNEEETQER